MPDQTAATAFAFLYLRGHANDWDKQYQERIAERRREHD
jgi:hypothetical protein